ncbi:MAG: PEP-CTERM sorting domain-containing protein [Opitutaceae bacterium]|jgi:hypothetical protein|nr:PEP-CTERM sorting domain-containing protein [Opitutaceae bacterium]
MHNKHHIPRHDTAFGDTAFDLRQQRQIVCDSGDNFARPGGIHDIPQAAQAAFRWLILIVGAVVAATFASASGWGLKDNAVTLLPYSGEGPAYAPKINNSGDVAGTGYTSYTNGTPQAIVWRGGNEINLHAAFDEADLDITSARTINDNGVVALSVTIGGTTRGMTWSGGTFNELTIEIVGKEVHATTASAINNSGVVAGHVEFKGEGAGLRGIAVWRNGEFSFLHDTTGGMYDSTPLAINNNGNMAGIVYANAGDPMNAAMWVSDDTTFTFVNLGGLIGSSTSIANGINDDGLVVGRATLDGITRAVIWRDTEGTFTDLHNFVGGGAYSYAYGINKDGAVAGDAEIDGTEHAVVWMPGTDGQYELVDINKLAAEAGLLVSGSDSPEGFLSLTYANDINNYNQVVGYGPYFDGTSVVIRSFILELEFVSAVAVPEPATWTVLAGLALLACATLCRRRRR